jgi:flagellar M-ring protein FliF
MDNSSIIEAKVTPMRQMHLGSVLRIPAVRQVLLLIGVAASVAAGFAVVLWSQTPDYAQLYGNLEGRDAAEVAEALRAADIRYTLNTDTGSVSVPAAKLHDARLELASQGLPQGASSGMEVMNGQSSFGVSQFMESARYQHALETELARTITHLGGVRDARVHLAVPKQSAFIRDQHKASASVLLQLNRGRELEPEQAAAIVHLVASSVQNLSASNVTLIDQNGRLLSSADERWSDMQAINQFKHAERLEVIYKRRIEELLTPLVGPGRVRAQVVAELDFTVTEETREFYDPSGGVVRSEQLSEERRSGNQAAAVGIPGALSNQPPGAGGETLENGQAAPPEAVNTSRNSTRNYEVDRTISHIRPQSGTVERLSVAVLVDNTPSAGAEANVDEALSEADIEQFTRLVKEAVGFDAVRGDTVVVVNAAFRDTPEIEALDEPAFWETPLLRDTMKPVLGALLVLVLAFGLVRPMLRGLLANNSVSSTEFIASGGVLMPAGTAMQPAGRPALEGPTFDEKVAAAKNITSHDPARVAQVVKKWVTRDE